jgi:glucose/arabinose dehydrogenase
MFAASGWDGTKFASVKAIYSGGKKFDGFNGIGFGPNGRLYAGISLNGNLDHKASPNVFGNSLVSMTANGKDVKVVAGGLRQPWQLTFMKGNKNPFVTVLAQDEIKAIPPDWIINAKPNQDYGFPTCTWASPKACRGLPKPMVLLPEHASPMGIQAVGKKLYVALFGGIGKSGPEVVSMTTKGKSITPVLQFKAPVVSIAIANGTLYAGDVTGSVYSVPL